MTHIRYKSLHIPQMNKYIKDHVFYTKAAFALVSLYTERRSDISVSCTKMYPSVLFSEPFLVKLNSVIILFLYVYYNWHDSLHVMGKVFLEHLSY